MCFTHYNSCHHIVVILNMVLKNTLALTAVLMCFASGLMSFEKFYT